MQAIHTSYSNLVNALENHASLVVTKDGYWYQRHWITSLFRRILGWEEDDKLQAAKKIVRYIQNVPYNLGAVQEREVTLSQSEISEILELVKSSIEDLAARDKNTVNALKSDQRNTTDPNAKKEIEAKKIQFLRDSTALKIERKIERTKIAITYLSKSQQEISNTSIVEADEKWLSKRLERWLSCQTIKPACPESIDDQKIKIDRALKYPEFIQAIRNDKILRVIFFKAVFRDGANGLQDIVDLFIQTPAIQKKLRKTYLDKRLQTVANRGLQFTEYSETKRKEINLLIHGKYQPITCGNHKVEVADGVHTTVDEVFQEFLQQNQRLLNMEYLQTGIEKYDCQLKDFNFDEHPEWWTKLPHIQTISADEVKSKFGSIQNNTPLFVARATRTYKDMTPRDTHAWLDVYLPLENGDYNILSLGKYANFFPAGTLEILKTIFSTEQAVFTLCDPNKFMNHREHIEYFLGPYPSITQQDDASDNCKDGLLNQAMEFIKKMFIDAREGRLNFQAQGDNCAAFVSKFIRNIFPTEYPKDDLFKVSFLDVPIPQPLKLIQSANNLFPNEEAWNYFRRIFSYMLGAHSKRVYKNEAGESVSVGLADFELWLNGHFYNPAHLFNHSTPIQSTLSQ